MRSTHTYAELPVSAAVYDEIAQKLRDAQYHHVFMEGGAMNMHGIGLTKTEQVPDGLLWQWWAGRDEDCYNLAGMCATREEAINIAYGDTDPGDHIYLIEAVAGEWNECEGYFEFTHSRNRSSVIREEDEDLPGG